LFLLQDREKKEVVQMRACLVAVPGVLYFVKSPVKIKPPE
jgi:hypothetical protein